MAITIRIPAPLRKFTHGEKTIEGKGEDLARIIQDLDLRYPGIRERIYGEEGIRRFINIYVNDEDIRFLDGDKTTLHDGDTVSIIPAISGGGQGGGDVIF